MEINRRKTSRTVQERTNKLQKITQKAICSAYTCTSRTEYTDVWAILTGLEWAETVLAADGDRETTGLMS